MRLADTLNHQQETIPLTVSLFPSLSIFLSHSPTSFTSLWFLKEQLFGSSESGRKTRGDNQSGYSVKSVAVHLQYQSGNSRSLSQRKTGLTKHKLTGVAAQAAEIFHSHSLP